MADGISVCFRSKKDKSKGVVKPDSSDPEPEGLTLLVPDIQRTAEIVYTATTSLRQANQGMYKTHACHFAGPNGGSSFHVLCKGL